MTEAEQLELQAERENIFNALLRIEASAKQLKQNIELCGLSLIKFEEKYNKDAGALYTEKIKEQLDKNTIILNEIERILP